MKNKNLIKNNNKRNRKIFTVILLIIIIWLAAFGFAVYKMFFCIDFDSQYWKDTNKFYLVYNMEQDFESADSYGHIEMFKISYMRTSMAKWLVEDGSLIGITRQEMEDLLGSSSKKLGGKYKDTVQYVVDAERRGIQFYGESGIIYKYFVISFDEQDMVKEVKIIKGSDV